MLFDNDGPLVVGQELIIMQLGTIKYKRRYVTMSSYERIKVRTFVLYPPPVPF